MSPDDYCWDRLDTDLRYAALMSPRRRRAAIAALMTVWQEIVSVPRTVTEPAVAAQTLGWWHDELARMASGAPRHPATGALARHLSRLEHGASRLDDVAASVLEEIALQRASTIGQVEALGARQVGPMLAMCAELLGAGDDAVAARTGAALKLLQVIRDTGWLARRERVLLPRAELERDEVGASDVLERRTGEAFDRLVRRLGRYAAGELAQAFTPPANHGKPWKPARALTAIALARQQVIDGAPQLVLDARVDLTPVRKLWVAWRGA